jgi:ATP-binding cassette subfamily B protein
LIKYALIIVLLAVIIAIFRFFWRILTIGNSWKISRDLREILFRHLETQPPSFYRNHESGKLMALMTNDIEAIRMSAGFGIVAAIDAIFMATLSLTMMLFIDVRLTLIALIPMPLI